MNKKEKIKKVINFKYEKKGKDTLQKKAVKALFAFLILMIGCTMLYQELKLISQRLKQ